MRCAHCLQEIRQGDPISYLGDRVAHMHRSQCIATLRATIEAKDAELAELRKCECGIDRDPNDHCEARCHLLNLLLDDPRDNASKTTVELVQLLADRADAAEARVKEAEGIIQAQDDRIAALQERQEPPIKEEE